MPSLDYDSVNAITSGQDERLSFLDTQWSYYMGDHEQFFPRLPGETDTRFNERIKIVDNLIGLMVDTKVDFLYGNLVSRRVSNPTIDMRMSKVWSAMKMEVFMQEVATETIALGDCYVMPKYYGKADYPKMKERVRYVIWPASFIYPLFDEHDINKVSGYVMKYYYKDNQAGRFAGDFTRRADDETHEYLSIMTEDNWLVWIDGKRAPQFEFQEGINPYNELILVRFMNKKVPNQFDSKSDVCDLIPINQQIDERLSDVAEVVRYHAFPILQAKNIKVGKLQRSPYRLYEISEPQGMTAGLEYVTYDSALPSSDLILNKLYMEFQKLSKVPGAALGNMEELGNLTSGRALQVLFAPLIRDINKKRLLFEMSEQQLMDVTLCILKFHENLQVDDEGATLILRWRAHMVPVDPVEDMGVKQGLLQSNLISQREALRQMNPDLPESVDDNGMEEESTVPRSIDEVVEEIQQEAEEKQAQQLELMQAQAALMPKPQGAASPKGGNLAGKSKRVLGGAKNVQK